MSPPPRWLRRKVACVATQAGIRVAEPSESTRVHLWARVLIIGFVAWIAAILALLTTRDPTVVPTVILIGSFLMPVTFLTWVFERQRETSAERRGRLSALSTGRVALAFAVSGVFGVSIAAVLETFLLANHPGVFYGGVAVIEEMIKMVLIIIVGRGLPYYLRRDGMVLGAAVGFGFAAFESAGYAFNTIIQAHSVELSMIVETEAVRGLLTPFGHGLWTALVGGALFYAAAGNHSRFRITANVVGWFAVAVVLHALWDMAAGISVALTYLVSGQPISFADVERGRLSDPTQWQAHLDGIFDSGLLGLCAIVGLWVATLQWRAGRSESERAESVRSL